MRRRIASILLTLLICQSALAGTIEIRCCDEIAPQATHHAFAVHQEDFADDGVGINDAMHDDDQTGTDDAMCSLCGGACMISEVVAGTATVAAQLPATTPNSAPASDFSSLYRPPAVS